MFGYKRIFLRNEYTGQPVWLCATLGYLDVIGVLGGNICMTRLESFSCLKR